MKPVTWDSGVRWGDPNLRWGSPSYLLEAGDEGFTPPPPAPAKKKPRRLSPDLIATTTPTPTPTAMSFQYYTAPKSGGGFTTRVALGPEFDEAACTAAVAAATQVPADKCPLVLQEYLRQFLASAANGCCWKSRLYDMLRIQPSSGGSATLPEGLATVEDIRPDVTLSLLPEVIEAWRATLTLETTGAVGLLTPVIEVVISEQTDAENTYTPLTMLRVRGNNLAFDKTNTNLGLFLKPAAGAEVRCTSYGPINPTEVIALVPTGLTGPLTARFVALISNKLRSHTYTTPLAQV